MIDTIAELTDDIPLGMNELKFTLAVFIDLRKAFDTGKHKILIKKCEVYGHPMGE